MSTRTRTSGAAAIAKVDALTVGGTVEVGDKFLVTIGPKTVTVSATSTSTSTTATDIATALEALDTDIYPEFAGITFSPSSAVVSATADDEGVDFTITVTTTESDGSAADSQTFVRSNTTANAGPKAWGGGGNWSGGAAPVAADAAVLENIDSDIQFDLSQAGATLASLTINASFEGTLGNPQLNPGTGGAEFPEYLATYLAIDASVVTIGDGDGDGSGLIRLNNGTVQTAVTVHKTGSSSEDGAPAFCWKGTNAANTFTANDGDIGICFFGGETATIATLIVIGARVQIGAGATLTTVTLGGDGSIDLRSGCTTLNLEDEADTVTALGSGNITTVNVFGGTYDSRRANTITNLNMGEAVADFTDSGAVTVTNCTITKGATIKDPNKRVTFTNGIILKDCTLEDVTLELGSNRTVSVT